MGYFTRILVALEALSEEAFPCPQALRRATIERKNITFCFFIIKPSIFPLSLYRNRFLLPKKSAKKLGVEDN
jgi:hypothetical protein